MWRLREHERRRRRASTCRDHREDHDRQSPDPPTHTLSLPQPSGRRNQAGPASIRSAGGALRSRHAAATARRAAAGLTAPPDRSQGIRRRRGRRRARRCAGVPCGAGHGLQQPDVRPQRRNETLVVAAVGNGKAKAARTGEPRARLHSPFCPRGNGRARRPSAAPAPVCACSSTATTSSSWSDAWSPKQSRARPAGLRRMRSQKRALRA